MNPNSKPGKAASEAAEKVLVTLYGEDLIGCPTSIDAIAAIIQEAVAVETNGHRQLAEALIRALRQIQTVSTPPTRAEVQDIQELARILGERADGIHQITSKILDAWDKTVQ
jgi:hypothetical protein